MRCESRGGLRAIFDSHKNAHEWCNHINETEDDGETAAFEFPQIQGLTATEIAEIIHGLEKSIGGCMGRISSLESKAYELPPNVPAEMEPTPQQLINDGFQVSINVLHKDLSKLEQRVEKDYPERLVIHDDFRAEKAETECRDLQARYDALHKQYKAQAEDSCRLEVLLYEASFVRSPGIVDRRKGDRRANPSNLNKSKSYRRKSYSDRRQS